MEARQAFHHGHVASLPLRSNTIVLRYNRQWWGANHGPARRLDRLGRPRRIAEHGLTPDEVEFAMFDESTTFDVSDSSGRPIAFGNTGTGRFIAVVFDVLNPAEPLVIRPITAYDVPEPTE